jgi:hypothetical protein
MNKGAAGRESSNDYQLDPSNYLEGWCARCGEPGYYALDPGKWEEAHLVICKSCGHEYCALWCPECGAGGNFVQDATTRPIEWQCEMCGGTHAIPPETYDSPIPAHNEVTAPAPISDWIAQQKRRYGSGVDSTTWRSPAVIVGWLVVALAIALSVLSLLIRFWRLKAP